MKKVGKRKIIILLAILTLCIIIFTAVFLKLQSWLHSDGMHFIGRYGQVHISQTCEGIDQDGNKIEPRDVVVDGVIRSSKIIGEELRFDGEITIDGLPELEKYGLWPAGASSVLKRGDGLYYLIDYTFMAASSSIKEKWDEEEEWNELSFGDVWCDAEVFLKDNEIAMKFTQGNTNDKYYIFYSDRGMLDIPVVKRQFFPSR